MLLRSFLLLFPAFIASAVARPNIVLFVTDDQSPIAGCYGSPLIRTPHLDQLAKEGTRFTEVFATTASCSASRSVILTGLHNHANGQYGHVHEYHKFETFESCSALSLPLQLKSLGYRTAHIGKLHVAPESVYGFERWIASRGPHKTPDWVEACKPLFNEKTEQPFFLCFWTNDPHRGAEDDSTAPEELKPNRFGNPATGQTYPGIEEVTYDPASLPVPDFLPDTPECRRELAQYYQSVTRTDKALGALVAALKEAGQYEKTMIVFTADHGMAFPGAKTTVYEAGLKVPFVVKMPGVNGGAVNDAMISHADITPALLDAAEGYDAGKRAPKTLLPVAKLGKGENPGPKFQRYHGKSWLNLLGKEHGEGWDSVLASHTFHEIQMYYPMRAIRDRQFKLIWNIAAPLPYPFASDLWAASTWQAQYKKGLDAPYGKRTVGSYIQRPVFELFDLKADPAESKNLADDPQHRAQLEAMKERLKAGQKETADPWALKWKYE
ncbi:sulfatase [Luteolibacter sp. GHJ8]|uniref:Sulfatase n=1 Tax=Luteolibacter rhizosphaerae TaxID=2989719 RepID=A0ABT3GAP7_9BACT|nr:sulfatase [Luteolibacter rhizosphaerae]MCW1916860.1 sulfatase [Luteolibacter rhizosphaerae]